MNKNLRSLSLLYGLALISTLIFCSCSDDKSDPVVELNLSGTAATVKVGGVSSEVEIISGNGRYEAVSSDNDVCIATVAGSTISLRGLSEGSATVTVTDAGNKTASIAVNVSATADAVRIKLDRYTASMEKWDRDRLRLEGGNGEYTFTYGTPGIAEAAVIDGQVVIYGHSAGTTTVTMTDRAGMQATFEASVSDRDFELETKSSSAVVLLSSNRRVRILSGNKNYTVQSSDESVVKAIITQDEVDGPQADATYYVEFIPQKLGDATVTLTDNNGLTVTMPTEVVNEYIQYLDINLARGTNNFNYIEQIDDPVVGKHWAMQISSTQGQFFLTDLTDDLPEDMNMYLTFDYTGHERAGTFMTILYIPPSHGHHHYAQRADGGGNEMLVWPWGCYELYQGNPEPARTDNTVFGTKSFELSSGMLPSIWGDRTWGEAGDFIMFHFGFGGYYFRIKNIRITAEDLSDPWMYNYNVGA